MGRKWEQGIFTQQQLRTWAEHGERNKVLAAVPVVSAWRAAMAKSKEGGYTFRVPKFQPRNPKNEPDAARSARAEAVRDGRRGRALRDRPGEERDPVLPADQADERVPALPRRSRRFETALGQSTRASIRPARRWRAGRSARSMGRSRWCSRSMGRRRISRPTCAGRYCVITILIGIALAVVAWFVTRKVVDPIASDLASSSTARSRCVPRRSRCRARPSRWPRARRRRPPRSKRRPPRWRRWRR